MNIMSMDEARNNKEKACGMQDHIRVLTAEEANTRKPSFLEMLARQEMKKK